MSVGQTLATRMIFDKRIAAIVEVIGVLCLDNPPLARRVARVPTAVNRR
jgi:hypothetical protein